MDETRQTPIREGCPDLETIAAYVDGRLEGTEKAEMEAHLASCDDCYSMFAETTRSETESGAGRSAVVRPRFGRGWIALAVAAALIAAAIPLAWRLRARRAIRPDVAELVAAVGAERPFEPRVTGGFQFGPMKPVYRSAAPAENESWELLAAAAKIRKKSEQVDTVQTLADLGVAQLLLGKYDDAVSSLEEASLRAPKDARILTDLSAAYLVRAKEKDRADDYPKALEAAEKATEFDPKILEAWFNRAYALETLYLKGEAIRAWKDYLDWDAKSAWAVEARKHRDALLAQPNHAQLWIREKPKLLAAAAAGDEKILLSIVKEYTQETREFLERELLPEWARKGPGGSPQSQVVSLESRRIAKAYQLLSGDGTFDDAASDLSRAIDLDELGARNIVFGVRSFRSALDLYRRDRYREARVKFETARALTGDRSPSLSDLYLWYSIASCYLEPNLSEAARLAQTIRARALTLGEPWIVAHSWWIEGSVSLDQGKFDQAGSAYERSMKILERIGSKGDVASVSAYAANALLFLGDMQGAWRDGLSALRCAPSVVDPDRRHTLYESIAVLALEQGRPRAALHLQNTALEAERSSESPTVVQEARTFRGRIQASLGNGIGARKDFEEADRLSAAIPTEGLRQRQQCQLAIMKATAGGVSDPAAAVEELTNGIRMLRSLNDSYYLPQAFMERGVRLERAGKAEAAVSDFRDGIDEFERNRRGQGTREISYFDRSWDLFRELIETEALTLGKPWVALDAAERFRSRQLLDYLGRHGDSIVEPNSIDQIQGVLQPDEELIYFYSLPGRTLVWALTSTNRNFAAVAVPGDYSLAALATELLTACQKGQIAGFPRDPRTAMYDALIRPLAMTLNPHSTLLLVPDSITASVPFAALLDGRSHRYLIQDHPIVIVPSGSVFYESRQRGWRHQVTREPSLLAIGGPPGSYPPGLAGSDLPAARDEVSAIADLYRDKAVLTGSAATVGAFARQAGEFEIVHFAGHALVNPEFPSLSFLKLAPDETAGDDGRLFGSRIATTRFDQTRLVILAACSTAHGFASKGEGTLNLARPFLAAGVPNVVASLWDVQDADTQRFMVAFHESLRAGNGIAEALQSAQVSRISEQGGGTTANPSWASFEVFGASQQNERKLAERHRPAEHAKTVVDEGGTRHRRCVVNCG